MVAQNEMAMWMARQDELEDLVGNIEQTFLGLTVNCSRCHDHQFDPISQEEYYRLVSCLSGIQHWERDLRVPPSEPELSKLQKRIKAYAAVSKSTRGHPPVAARPGE